MKALRVAGNLFILVGATLLLFVVYEFVGTSLVTNGRQDALAQEFETIIAPPLPSASPSPTPTKKHRRKGPQPLGRIRIPKIGVKKIVVEGTSLESLAYGPGHYVDTPLFGAVGTTGIAGHRTGWGSPFFNLDRLARGDDVFLETKEAIYTYRVTSTRIVNPGDYWVLQGDPKSKATKKLALTTCTPKFTSRDRLVVWADLIKTQLRAPKKPAPAPVRTGSRA
jgi:sortase A